MRRFCISYFHAAAANTISQETSMIQRTLRVLFAIAVATTAVSAQEKPKQERALRDLLIGGWTEINQKVVQMAESLPEEKYEFRATKDVRTFADVLRHVAFWNDWVVKAVRGEKPDGRPNELPKAQYSTKAQIVAALKKSVDAGLAQLKAGPATPPTEAVAQWMSFIGHSSEHYGQLVVYYRLNGLVPPASRSQ
jgi:uncharacterized damage-inducible protein DinB